MFYIAVVGGSRCDPALGSLAGEVGAGIAGRGAVLVCGGGSGVMEAASRAPEKMGVRSWGYSPETTPGRATDT